MRTAIEEEPALIFGVLAPFGVPPFRLLGHEVEDSDREVSHTAKIGSRVARKSEGRVEADVFSDGKGCAVFGIGGSVGYEVSGCSDIFGNGLLGEDVLAG